MNESAKSALEPREVDNHLLHIRYETDTNFVYIQHLDTGGQPDFNNIESIAFPSELLTQLIGALEEVREVSEKSEGEE
jgi:arginine utilization protein RocB